MITDNATHQKELLDMVRHLMLHINESNWTTLTYATTSNNIACSVNDPQATRWCLLGHIMHTFGDAEHTIELTTLLEKYIPSKYSSLSNLNDKGGLQAIHKLLMLCIKKSGE